MLALELVIFASAIAAGIGSGLLGIGGAIIFVPLALFVAPVVADGTVSPTDVAALSSLFVVTASSIGGLMHRRRGHVDGRLVAAVGPAMLAGGAIGALVSLHASAVAVVAGFALFATASMAAVLSSAAWTDSNAGRTHGPIRRAASVGGIIGIGAGFVGAGGAFALVPGLVRFSSVPARIAIGSSLWIALLGTGAASLVRALAGQIPWALAPVTVTGAVLGAYLGVRAGDRLNPSYLRTALSVVLATVAIRMWMEVAVIVLA